MTRFHLSVSLALLGWWTWIHVGVTGRFRSKRQIGTENRDPEIGLELFNVDLTVVFKVIGDALVICDVCSADVNGNIAVEAGKVSLFKRRVPISNATKGAVEIRASYARNFVAKSVENVWSIEVNELAEEKLMSLELNGPIGPVGPLTNDYVGPLMREIKLFGDQTFSRHICLCFAIDYVIYGRKGQQSPENGRLILPGQ